MNITQLSKKKHDRKAFDCGEEALNNYLKTLSGQHDKKDLSRTFVLTSPHNEAEIKGFYSLALCTVSLDDLPAEVAKKYPTEIHCALIGRLAVNKQHQKQGFGQILLIDAVRNAIASSELVPTPMIIVDAKNEEAKNYYEEFGFECFPKQPNRLFLPRDTAILMLKEIDS
jgi:GNAT superfamily N-acetyltransferase